MIDPVANGSINSPVHHISPVISQGQQTPHWTPIADSNRMTANERQDTETKPRVQSMTMVTDGQKGEKKAGPVVPDADSALISGGSVSERDEEAVVYNYTRMLQDPSGRLCKCFIRRPDRVLNTRCKSICGSNSRPVYIGDSATLSFLQLIRMIVDNVAGPSPFTLDPNRHRIVEHTISLPPNIRHTHLLPDRQTANVLVDAYFTNVSMSP